MTPPLPGMSVRLYQVFSESVGRWSTPNWAYGVQLGPPRAYKQLQIKVQPVTTESHATPKANKPILVKS